MTDQRSHEEKIREFEGIAIEMMHNKMRKEKSITAEL